MGSFLLSLFWSSISPTRPSSFWTSSFEEVPIATKLVETAESSASTSFGSASYFFILRERFLPRKKHPLVTAFFGNMSHTTSRNKKVPFYSKKKVMAVNF